MAKKGFTLLELVIVIGILAILGAVSVLVLNPAQLLAQARDTTRIEDMSVMRNALALYVSTVTSPDMDGGTTSCSTLCYVGTSGVAAACGGRHAGKTTTIDTTREVNGGGWIPVDLSGIPGGAPLAVLPIDPSNTTTNFYSYACDDTAKTFELNAKLESTRYSAGGPDDREGADGGNDAAMYEVGTAPGLAL
jgi:prepilin-type N-terminal cleavage/methylation domain-containing protein